MAYIPINAKWYIAELIEEIDVQDNPLNVVHRNLVLVRADSPEDAYQKSLLLGRASEVFYANPDGKDVHITFRGLAGLGVIHDDLDHGAELLYEERVGVPREEIEKWVIPKEQLSVFRPATVLKNPDYSSLDAVDDAERFLP